MTNKRLLASFGLLLICLATSAQAVTNIQAVEKVRKFLRSERLGKRMAPGATVPLKQVSQQQILPDTRDNQLYIFNIGDDDGFVIVSGDERTPEILGYTDKGSINAHDMPENMRFWLQGYAEEILALQNNAEGSEVSDVSMRPAVPSFLGCEWGQDAPYNLQCPVVGGHHAPTGCEATALAQVLYYLRPENVTSIPSYTTDLHGIEMPTLPATTFNWDIMRPAYSSVDTNASAQEVARLMLYCGQHLSMDYKENSSTAYSTSIITKGDKDHFGISNATTQYLRDNLSSKEWDAIIYREISNHRPVIVSGAKSGSGHAFLCDGYDGNGLYHINWGWDGSYNGYFSINRLSPKTQMSGGTNDGYNGNCRITVGLEKNDGIMPLSIYGITGYEATSTRASQDSDFNVTISAKYKNYSTTETNFQVCWGIFDENDDLVGLSSAESLENAKEGTTELKDKAFALGAGLNDGVYTLRGFSHQDGVSEWKMCPDAYMYDLIMTVSGNTAVLQKPESHTFGTVSYNISNVSIEGSHASNTQHVISFDLENVGNTYTGTLHLCIEGTKLHEIAVNVDPNETDRLATTFTISIAGTFNISLREKSSGVVLYETMYDIEKESFCPMKFKLTPEQYVRMEDDVYIVNTNEVMINYEMTNEQSVDYKSNVKLIKYREHEENASVQYVYPVVVPAHGKVTMQHPLTGIIDGDVYEVHALYRVENGYYLDNDETGIKVKYDPFATGINDMKADMIQNNAPAYNIMGQQVDAKTAKGIIIQNGKKVVKE